MRGTPDMRVFSKFGIGVLVDVEVMVGEKVTDEAGSVLAVLVERVAEQPSISTISGVINESSSVERRVVGFTEFAPNKPID